MSLPSGSKYLDSKKGATFTEIKYTLIFCFYRFRIEFHYYARHNAVLSARPSRKVPVQIDLSLCGKLVEIAMTTRLGADPLSTPSSVELAECLLSWKRDTS